MLISLTERRIFERSLIERCSEVNSIKDLLKLGEAKLSKSGTPKLDAEILLSKALEVPKAYLFSHPEELVDKVNENLYLSFIERRSLKEPAAYIIGKKEFYGIDFEVNKSVLIPRPETELIVDKALEFFEGRSGEKSLLDLGTGTGCIAISVAMHLKSQGESLRVVATDVSIEALEVSRRNAKILGLTKEIEFILSDWFDEIPVYRKFSCIVSNPPYIPVGDTEIGPGLEFEPPLALFSGPAGLDAIRKILTELPDYLEDDGISFIEFGFGQKDEISSLVQERKGLELKNVYEDLAGIPRVLAVKKRAF